MFSIPTERSPVPLPGLTGNSDPLQRHPDQGFLSSGSWLPPLPHGDSRQSQYYLLPKRHTLLSLRLMAIPERCTLAPRRKAGPSPWEVIREDRCTIQHGFLGSNVPHSLLTPEVLLNYERSLSFSEEFFSLEPATDVLLYHNTTLPQFIQSEFL